MLTADSLAEAREKADKRLSDKDRPVFAEVFTRDPDLVKTERDFAIERLLNLRIPYPDTLSKEPLDLINGNSIPLDLFMQAMKKHAPPGGNDDPK